MLWHGRLMHWTGLRGRGGRVGNGHDLEDADILPRVQAERLWPLIVDSYPQLGTAGKRGNPGHECRQSVLRVKIDVLCGPWVVAADEPGRFHWYLCCLEQQSAASGVGGSGWRSDLRWWRG